MANNFKSVYVSGSDKVTTFNGPGIIALHAYSPTAGTFDITDGGGSLIKCKLPASGTSDIYIGEMGIKATATISVSAPASAAAITLILG
jgi:hypothetical protein